MTHIMLIRHAEKPEDEADTGLSLRGWQRAGALVRFFAPIDAGAVRKHVEQPGHVFAARPTDEHTSPRPRLTVEPLAEELGLQVDERFSASEPVAHVAQVLRLLTGPVVVSWRHDELPALANALLGREEAPLRWPDHRYDLVWVIRATSSGWSFTQVPQRLLPGDATQGIARRLRTAPSPA